MRSSLCCNPDSTKVACRSLRRPHHVFASALLRTTPQSNAEGRTRVCAQNTDTVSPPARCAERMASSRSMLLSTPPWMSGSQRKYFW